MYSPNLYSSLVNVHIDDLRRGMAASRHRRSGRVGPSDRGPRRPRSSASNKSFGGLAARFAH